MKRVFSFVFAIMMIFVMASCQLSEDPSKVYEYESTEGGIKLVSYKGNRKIVEVPTVIENKKVVDIGSAFSGNVMIEEIILPEGLSILNFDYCFVNCDSLKSIKINGTAPEIEYSNELPSVETIIFEHIDFEVDQTYDILIHDLAKACTNITIYEISNYSPLAETIYQIGTDEVNFTIPGKMEERIRDSLVYLGLDRPQFISKQIAEVYGEELLASFTEDDAVAFCFALGSKNVVVNGISYSIEE